jgi:hypothetical protein
VQHADLLDLGGGGEQQIGHAHGAMLAAFDEHHLHLARSRDRYDGSLAKDVGYM